MYIAHSDSIGAANGGAETYRVHLVDQIKYIIITQTLSVENITKHFLSTSFCTSWTSNCYNTIDYNTTNQDKKNTILISR